MITHSNEKAAHPALDAALESGVKGGEHFGPQGFMDLTGPPRRAERTAYSEDEAVAARLWEVSEKLVGEKFTPLSALAIRGGSDHDPRVPR